MTPGYRECPRCGAEFKSTGDWVYRIKTRGKQQIFCGWKCYQAALAEQDKQKKIKRNLEKLERARAKA
jgi:hypothetical protein